MTNFVCSSLGIQSINPPSSNLGDLLSSTRCGQPIFLVLGTSADPAQELQDLADKSKAEFHLLAMGNSQQHAAMDLLRKCIDGGSWLCLSNLHLVPEFLLKIHGVGFFLVKCLMKCLVTLHTRTKIHIPFMVNIGVG